MSQYLKQYELIPEAVQGRSAINLAGSELGDPPMRFVLDRISDIDAAALLARKDGLGARFVRPAAPAKAAK